jgi:general secretion pathway protein A
MQYYRILGLEREPFSTSPDPDFLFLSREHDLVRTNILIQLHLRRGLNVVLGDIGTGKTTLSRKLVQELRDREKFLFHVTLNPTFESEKEFLYALIKNFQIPFPGDAPFSEISVTDMRDVFEKFLLHKTVSDNRIVTLIIDEAQKLSLEALEALRVLLNYETNEYKLIQLVLLGQLELHSKIMQMHNFYDRIDFKFTLNPLGCEETRSMVEFRIKHAGYSGLRKLFEDEAITDIYHYTKGYPRGIIRICHNCLRELVMSKAATAVDRKIVADVIAKDSASRWQTTAVPQNTSS